MEDFRPIRSLDEITDGQRPCDFCSEKDKGDEIRCPNGGVPVPLEPKNVDQGFYLCFGVPVQLAYNNL